MLRIDNISNDPLQKRSLILEDGSSFTFTMHYVEQQYGWFITNLFHNNFIVKNIRITNNLNILYQYETLIGFGLACITEEDREPTQLEDFSSGASKLYVLTLLEAAEYSRFVRGEV